MNEVHKLEGEHSSLCCELNALVSAKNAGNRSLLEEIICLIEKRLEEHIEREEEVFKCGQSVLREVLLDKGLKHDSSMRGIKTIKSSIKNKTLISPDQEVEEVGKFIACLRRQVARQEAEVFPVLEPLWVFRRPQGDCEILAE